MRSFSFLKWFFIALLHPLQLHAFVTAPQSPQSFGYMEPDVPANVGKLPASRPDLFGLSRTPPPLTAKRSSATLPSPDNMISTPGLRFGLDSTWRVSEMTFGGASGPISANLLRAPGKAQRELERGLEAAKRSQWEKAKGYLQKSLEIYPSFSAAHHNLGVIALMRGEAAEGEAHIEHALVLDDRNLYALFALCQIRLAHQDDAAAERYIARFLTLAPEDPYGLALLAAVEMRQGRIDAALRTFARLERKEHRNLSDFHLLAGSLYEAKLDLNRAVAEYKEFLRENPRATNHHVVAEAIAKLQTFMAAK